MLKTTQRQTFGFTIVELLVVIVVIGILAAISIVSYAGITERAITARITSDLNSDAKLLELYKVEYEGYPSALDTNTNCPTAPSADNKYCMVVSEKDDTLTYTGGGNDYTLTITDDDSNLAFQITPGGIVASVTPVEEATVTKKTFASAWGGTNSEYASYVVQTKDGGYAVTGGTNNGDGGDALIAKYNASGVLEWNKTWGGSGIDNASSITQTNDGGFLISGTTDSFTSYSPVHSDAFIAKFSSSGDLLWNKTWGGNDVDSSFSAIQTADGGYIMTGTTFSYGVAGNADIFIAKYDTSGGLSWSKTWGGTSGEFGNSIIQTSDGGYAVAGQTWSFGAGDTDMVIIKFDSSGNVSWNKTWGGSISDEGNSIIQTGDDGYIVVGRTSSFGGGYNSFSVKYDSSGNMLWNKNWGGSNTDGAYSVANTSDDGFVVFGSTRSYGAGDYDGYVSKYDSSGNIIWTNTFGGSEFDCLNSGLQTVDGGYVVVGRTSSYVAAASNDDLLIIKYDADGSMPGCDSPMCKSSSTYTSNPAATTYTPSASVSSPPAASSAPSAAVSSLDLTSTYIVTPPVPPPAMTVTFSSDELRVLYPGEDQTACKEWTVPNGKTIKGFLVTQESEDGYDFFTVSADGTEVYSESGYKSNMYVDISGTPATTLSACMSGDESYQDGYGGEVTGVLYN